MSRWRYITYLVCVALLPVAGARATEPMSGDSWWQGQQLMGGYAAASDPYAYAAGPAQQTFGYEDYASCGPAIPQQLPTNCGYFFQYDYLLWSVNAPRVTTIGDAGSERTVNVGGVSYHFTNSLDTSWIGEEFHSGHRWEFGNQGEQDGWIGSVLYGSYEESLSASGVNFAPIDPYNLLAGYEDLNGDGIDDDRNGNHVFGRYGEDLGTPDPPNGFTPPFDNVIDQAAPTDVGDQVLYLVTFGNFQVHNTTTLAGVEFMYSHRTCMSDRNQWTWFGGVRYLSVEDQFGFTATGGILDATSLDTTVHNNVVGPQVGGRWVHRRGWFSLSAEGRFLAGLNAQRGTMTGQIATNAQATGLNEPAALTATAFNDAVSDEVFSPIGEVRVDSRYFINRFAAFRVGYTGIYAGGISRAAPKVVYELPHFWLSNTASREGMFIHALTFGFELNR